MKNRPFALAQLTTTALTGLASLLLLAERFWMARIFWQSGPAKIKGWGDTVHLFASDYHVPVIPPVLLSYAATAVEMVCPVLLVFGLASRLAVVPMLIITLAIELTYTSHPDHAVWAMLLGTILCFGPGKLSLDHWLKRRHGG